jgi:hypothetical protein
LIIEETLYPQQKIVARPGNWTRNSWVWSQDSTTELTCLWRKIGAKLVSIYYTNIFWDIKMCWKDKEDKEALGGWKQHIKSTLYKNKILQKQHIITAILNGNQHMARDLNKNRFKKTTDLKKPTNYRKQQISKTTNYRKQQISYTTDLKKNG